MKDRIKEYIDFKGISPGELAGLLDVQRSNISHILNGRNKPGASLIERFLILFPELDARWLMTGEGNMTDEPNVANNINKNDSTEKEIFPPVKEASKNHKNQSDVKKSIDKVVLIYRDGSFSEHNPF